MNATVPETPAEPMVAVPSSRLAVLLLLLQAACDRTPAHIDRPPTPPAATNAAPEATASHAPSARPAPHGQGDAQIPFDFPQVPTTAQVGSYVLAPPRSWIDAALEKGAGKQAFIYYGGWMRAPGPWASEIETLTQQRSVIPNALVIAISKGQKASPGKLVLTSWASGTGMQRAIVMPGGSAESPKVRYLDMSLEHPTGWGEREDQLPKDTFMTLEQTGAVGASAACREGDHRMRYIITARSGDRLLGYGFAGKIAAFALGDCELLPLDPELREDRVVYAPVQGRYTKVKIRRVEASVGRAWARYKSDQEDQVAAFALLDIAVKLD